MMSNINSEISKVGVVGSRSFTDYCLMESVLDNISSISKIISGGAIGADKLAERYAKEHDISLVIFKLDWNTYGKSAGVIRNKTIVENSDAIVAFWDGESKGTQHTINIAKDSGKNINIIQFNK